MATWDFEGTTVRDLIDMAVQAEHDGEAVEFLAAYRETTEHADANLGYVFGYLSPEARERLYAAYRVNHPVFGGSV